MNYLTREGDFLLEILIPAKGIDCADMFYFLTANTGDSLKCVEAFENVVTVDLCAENILEKGDPNHTEKLLGVIHHFARGNFRVKMKDVFQVFDQGLLPKETEREFVATLLRMDEHELVNAKDNLARIRRIQEAIYVALSKHSEEIIPSNLLKTDHGFLKTRKIIEHLKDNGHHDGVIKSFAYEVWSISSDNGSHTPYENPDYPPTQHTVQAMTHALCDLILWFKGKVG